MTKTVFAAILLCGLNFTSCNDADPSEKIDAMTVARGEQLFSQQCSSCHNFNQDAIGPQLSGVAGSTNANWMHDFIRNPKAVIESGDAHAIQLVQKYHAVMPSFAALTDAQLTDIIAFLQTKKPLTHPVKDDPDAVKNPVPEKIALSGLVLNLERLIQVPASSDNFPKTRINKLDYEPTSGDLYVMDLRGKLYSLNGSKAVVYLDLAEKVRQFIHEPGLGTGFGSFAFHPDFEHNGLLYTSHTEPAASRPADFSYDDTIRKTVQWVITEWKASDPHAAQFTGSSRELFRLDMVEGMHGVQEIAFNPVVKPGHPEYGKLYIGIGDGAAAEKGYPFLAANKDRVYGKILRIDPLEHNSKNGRYGIPSDNPFVTNGGKILPEIYSSGFRNPNRINWTASGKMLVTNIGHGNIEALYEVAPGTDQGWPYREGNFEIRTSGNMNNVFALTSNDTALHYNYPIAEYDHDEGKAIAGGYAYSGSLIKSLKGKYIFGDIVTARLFYIDMNEAKPAHPARVHEWQVKYNGVLTSLHDLCGNDRVDLRFGHDKKGEIYILTKSDGMIYRLLP
jgi:glucose/arabinose dehydrogenase/mono/diheme cytochrome c family protein